jgi:hypothetical protein
MRQNVCEDLLVRAGLLLRVVDVSDQLGSSSYGSTTVTLRFGT